MENQDQVLHQLEWRYAVKRFDPSKKISTKDWHVLEESLRLAPSSYGLQPWKFVIVQNPEVRKKLRANSWNQSQVEECSHFVVLTTRTEMKEVDIQKFIDRIAEVRGVSKESLDGFKKGMMGDIVNGPRSQVIQAWAQRQAYIAMGFLMETAALLSIDTCPLEGLDPRAYDEILQLNGSGFATIAAVAVGYRHSEDSFQNLKKVRFKSEDVIAWVK